MTEDIVHQGVKVVNWIKCNPNLIRNIQTGAYFQLYQYGRKKHIWSIDCRGPIVGLSGTEIIYAFEDDPIGGAKTETEARAAFERIAQRLGAVDLLAESEERGSDRALSLLRDLFYAWPADSGPPPAVYAETYRHLTKVFWEGGDMEAKAGGDEAPTAQSDGAKP